VPSVPPWWIYLSNIHHRDTENTESHREFKTLTAKLLFKYMKIISISVGRPRLVMSNGNPVSTAIFKQAVSGPLMLRRLNLDGDRQADLSVHGGISKAVYAYPNEHYQFWRTELPELELNPGMFGENFTSEGLFEGETNVGDRFRVGEAELMATEPRLPCYKLGIRFGRTDIIKRFLQSRRTGIYFSVVKEGMVEAGNQVELLSRDPNNISIADITRVFAFEKDDVATLRRLVKLEPLSESWREHFAKQLDGL
jgi:MOSC domain-containing protein YiiM